MTVILALLVFGVLVFVHEFGHFITAKKFGVTVKEFAIGMGPTLFSVEGKPDDNGNRTKYAVRLLPLGGFVSMEGEDQSSDDEGAFCNKKVWNRLIIVAAGAITNLILGFLCMAILVGSMGTYLGTTIGYREGTVPQTPLQAGDKILSVDGSKVHIDYDLRYIIMRKGIKPVDVEIERNGTVMTLYDVQFGTITEEGMIVGTIDFGFYREEATFGVVVKHTFWRSVTSVRMIWESLYDLITGRYGMEALSGPIGVAGAISEAASFGWQSFLSMVALISINLGVCNLLPIPALDGGRFVFLLVEAVRKKPIKAETEGMIHFVGLVLLMLLMLVVTFRDIGKLLG